MNRNTLRFLINVALRLLILGKFSRGYALIWRGYAYYFLQNAFFKLEKLDLRHQISWKSSFLREGVCLFEGVHLLFLPNFPGGMFTLAATLIRNSRVARLTKFYITQSKHYYIILSAAWKILTNAELRSKRDLDWLTS